MAINSEDLLNISLELDDLLMNFANKHNLEPHELLSVTIARLIRLTEDSIDCYKFMYNVCERQKEIIKTLQ